MDEIALFLAEDVGEGDVTTNAIVSEGHISEAVIIAKDETVIAGHDYVWKVFESLDRQIDYQVIVGDGKAAQKGETVSTLRGKTRAILTGERVALNIFQRLSGVAAATKEFVDAVRGTDTKILDTRKTSPGLRAMEKYAVRMGGGENHRFNLSEMALVKENHITAAGSIKVAVERIRGQSAVPIEVEVKNMTELAEAVEEMVDRIMLDNWKVEEMGKAVSFVKRRIPIEVSGNMTIEKARAIADMGVDFISVGRITHSVKSADLSLLIM